VHAPGALLTGPAALCAAGGIVLGIVTWLVDADARSYAAAYPPGPEDYHLALWHGLGLPLLFSAVAIGTGYALHHARATVSALAHRTPAALDAQHGYEVVVRGIERSATRITGRLQVGSVPAYLGIIIATVLALPGVAFAVGGSWPAGMPLYHAALQVPLAVVIIVAALAVLRARRRFTAVLLVGTIGYGVGGLFIVDGAPDLALAQFLVETLSLVAFVYVLRRLPAHFQQSRPRFRWPKALVSIAGGAVVAGIAVMLSAARRDPAAVSAEFVRLAPEAGADNVISAILVDFRALDTLGEITVLFVAAAGVASLVLATPFDRRDRGGTGGGSGTPELEREVVAPRSPSDGRAVEDSPAEVTAWLTEGRTER